MPLLGAAKGTMEQFITTKEVMEKLNVSRAGLTLMLKRGSFPQPDVKGNGSMHRWKESTIKHWQDNLGKERS